MRVMFVVVTSAVFFTLQLQSRLAQVTVTVPDSNPNRGQQRPTAQRNTPQTTTTQNDQTRRKEKGYSTNRPFFSKLFPNIVRRGYIKALQPSRVFESLQLKDRSSHNENTTRSDHAPDVTFPLKPPPGDGMPFQATESWFLNTKRSNTSVHVSIDRNTVQNDSGNRAALKHETVPPPSRPQNTSKNSSTHDSLRFAQYERGIVKPAAPKRRDVSRRTLFLSTLNEKRGESGSTERPMMVKRQVLWSGLHDHTMLTNRPELTTVNSSVKGGTEPGQVPEPEQASATSKNFGSWWTWAAVVIMGALIPGLLVGFFSVSLMHKKDYGEWLWCYQQQQEKSSSHTSTPDSQQPWVSNTAKRTHHMEESEEEEEESEERKEEEEEEEEEEIPRRLFNTSPPKSILSSSQRHRGGEVKYAGKENKRLEAGADKKTRMKRWLVADKRRSARGEFADTDSKISDSSTTSVTSDTSVSSVGGSSSIKPGLVAAFSRGATNTEGAHKGPEKRVHFLTSAETSKSITRPVPPGLFQGIRRSTSVDPDRTYYYNNSAQPADSTDRASSTVVAGLVPMIKSDLVDSETQDVNQCHHGDRSCEQGADCDCLRHHHHHHVIRGGHHYIV